MADFNLRLVSTKTIFRLEDMTPEEIRIWTIFLRHQGYEATPEDFFLIDEPSNDIQEEVGTNELRIRYWIWNQSGVDHDVVDMNYFPGDNENGVVFIDQQMRFLNTDQSLDPWTQDEPKFRVGFEQIRQVLHEDTQLDDLEPPVVAWRDSPSGQDAIRKEIIAHKKWADAVTELESY